MGSQDILKNKVRRFILQDRKTVSYNNKYLIGTRTETNRVNSPEIDQHTYDHMIYNKDAIAILWKKAVLLNNGVGT